MSNAAGPHRSGTTVESTGRTPITVETERELDAYLGSLPRALVVFGADWCRPCRTMEPTVAEIAESVGLPLFSVDVEALPQVTVRFDVTSIPTLLVLEDGEVTDRLVGNQGRSKLVAVLE